MTISATIPLGQQQIVYASSDEERTNNNPIIKTETKTMDDGQMYRVETFADGQRKMTKLGSNSGTGGNNNNFCAYMNPEVGTTYSSKDCNPNAPLKPGSGVIMDPTDETTYDLPPYGEGGLVDPDDLPSQEGNE